MTTGGLPDALLALLRVAAILLLVLPLCMSFGTLLGALFAHRHRVESGVAFGATLVASALAPLLLLVASQQGGAWWALLPLGLALPGATHWLGARWAARR